MASNPLQTEWCVYAGRSPWPTNTAERLAPTLSMTSASPRLHLHFIIVSYLYSANVLGRPFFPDGAPLSLYQGLWSFSLNVYYSQTTITHLVSCRRPTTGFNLSQDALFLFHSLTPACLFSPILFFFDRCRARSLRLVHELCCKFLINSNCLENQTRIVVAALFWSLRLQTCTVNT